MLVLYTLREFDFCTLKQIYDSYMLPRQAMSYTNSFMRANEIFELIILEERTVKAMSKDKISTMAKLVLEFNNILNLFLNEKV